MPSSQSGLVGTGVAATGARIFDTLFEPEFAVYTLPAASMAIAIGRVPVVPRMDGVPSGGDLCHSIRAIIRRIYIAVRIKYDRRRASAKASFCKDGWGAVGGDLRHIIRA